MPMFTAILSWIILKDRQNPYRVGGLVALLLGLVMLGWGGFFESSAGAWKGDHLFLAGATPLGMFYRCCTLLEHRW